jgi:zinc transport system substrate-binding protein
VRAFVTIPPQAQFVERVGGDHVQVGILVKPGHSPHTYEPTPRQMTELAEAGVYFLIGVPFEDILKERIRSANPDMAMVDTGRGIDLREMETHHTHGETEEHEHEEHEHREHNDHEGRKDPHVWLDPANVRVMAGHIAEALVEQDPENEADYRANLEEFRAELNRLDTRIRESLEGVEQREILVFHPAFGYFTDAYGLEQVPIEIEGKEPGAKALSELISFAKERGIKVVFVQKQFSSKTAQVVAREIDGQVVPLDPLARDYIGTMEDIAEAFAEALQ